jgi:hypothetical protein
MTVRGRTRRRASLGVTVVALIAMTACADLCANEILAEVPSPSGELRAVVFERDCGATTGFSVQVSILRRGEPLSNVGGNAFTADAGHSLLPPLEVRAEWESDRALRLTYDPRLRTFTKESTVSGVTLIYASTGSR